MNKFTKNLELFHLIAGKRVVLVGPSPHLMKSDLGKVIDQYDIVARVSDYYPGGFETDYGSRTDVMFDSCDDRGNEDTLQKMYRYEDEIKQIKLVILPCLQASASAPKDGSSIVRNFDNNNIWSLSSWFIGVENFYWISNRVGTEPNSGITALSILLEHEPAELFLTGFSFYLQWNQKDVINSVYRPGYYIDIGVMAAFDWNSWTPEASHNQRGQIDYFKNVLQKYRDVLKIDSYLSKLLGIHPLKVHQL